MASKYLNLFQEAFANTYGLHAQAEAATAAQVANQATCEWIASSPQTQVSYSFTYSVMPWSMKYSIKEPEPEPKPEPRKFVYVERDALEIERFE